MASILRFVPRAVFDDGTTRLMGEAFDAVCRAQDGEHDATAAERIARHIIAATRLGERDPTKLRAAGFAALAKTEAHPSAAAGTSPPSRD